ncbi:GGDEF domain-containing protein [Nitratidesulfovibrio liaohensis]|uniref:GGDEF domain-containing protein n=1 Tax=Nitratidesulfovibrio liaohensis TaxID=2604158 RepID=UPI0014245F11|nr:GGDEF domain-containing protein [Nitratidesulfovibrio liaohensis]NHZ48298.1 GGDEF domain-containing protein [Nitratidesulfovibrio liaohensis]
MASLSMALCVLCAVTVALLLVHGHLDGDGHDLRLLALGKGMQAAGWLGFGLATAASDVMPPYRFLLLVGLGFEALAIVRVRTGWPTKLWPLLAGVVALHALLAVAVADRAFEVQTFVQTLAAAMLFLPGGVLLLTARGVTSRRLHGVAGGTYLIVAAFTLVRGGYLLARHEGADMPAVPHMEMIGLLLLQALAFIGCVWFVVVVRERYEAHIQRLATTDALTGLRNRRHFLSAAEPALALAARKGTPVGVLIFDVDHFKRVNDTHGHSVGDAVLRCIGEVLPTLVRGYDAACRYGGEEFAALLPDADEAVTDLVGERIRQGLEQAGRQAAEEGRAVVFTVSVGGSCRVPAGPQDMDALLGEADAALYEAKRGGRNVYRRHGT